MNNFQQFENQIRLIAEKFAEREKSAGLTQLKAAIRHADEQRKPLAQYRHEELEQMKRNFWGADRSYHLAREAFVRKEARQSGLLPNCSTVGSRRSAANRLAYETTGWSSTIGNL